MYNSDHLNNPYPIMWYHQKHHYKLIIQHDLSKINWHKRYPQNKRAIPPSMTLIAWTL